MIYLFNQTEELIDVIDEASLADFTHTIELNRFDRASFEIPVDYKPNIIKEAQFFGFQSRDRAFCLFRISEKSYDLGLSIQGIDRAESDLHSFIIEDKRPGGTASDVLREILKGTGYHLGNVDGLTINGNMSFYYISVRQALVKLIESYACEFKIRYTFVENKIIGRYIDLNQRFGRKTGHQFEYGSNILNVTYEESSDEVVTALIGRGKGEQSTNESGEATGGYGRRIQFKDVVWSVSKGDPVDKPAGQNYVANEAARNIYGLHQNGVIKHRFGVYTNEDIEDPVELLKATYKELKRLSVPIVTFKANLLDLANAIEQDIWIGDSVGIVRDQIGIAFEARIHKLIIDKLDDNRSVVELGDYQTLQAKDRSTRQQAIKDAVSGFSEGLIEEAIANEVDRQNKEFDEKIRVNKLEFDNELQRAKERAEEIKRQISSEIDKKFQSFDNAAINEARRKAEEAIRNAGASTLLAQEAKRIGLDSVAKLEEFKRQATSAQTALLGDLDVLKRTIANDIRPKQAQAEAEISKQVEALVQTKKELAGVKSAQSTFEQSTTRRLSELTNLANGKASKSELTQTAEELTSKIASVQVAHRNQGDRVSAIESNFRQRADALDAGVSRLTEGLRTKADISSLNVTAENIRQSVKSLETSTQNKLDQKLSQAEFEVQAGSIRQEILNATKDKADKTLVVAEAGKLREEFSNLRVGGTNLLKGSKGPFLPDRKPANFDNAILYVGQTSIYMEQGQEYIISAKTDGTFTAHHDGNKESDNVVLWIMDKDVRNYQIVSDLKTGTTGTKIIWNKPTGIYHLRVNTYHKEATKSVWDVKIEKGNVATDWSPAPEDTDGLITEAKAIFERTAQGLRTDLSAIQEYVNKDGQRQDALQRYAREESAKQATAVRELVARDYVGKSTYQEDVRGLERRFEAITNPQNGSIATQIANYKTAVDGRFSDITSLIAGKANQTDFQRVKETSQLYERILGNSENGIADKIARMAMTNQLFQVEVSKVFENHRNLFLSSTATKGFLGNAGVINVANSTQKEITSDFISVEPNEKIIFQHWVTLPENGMAWTAWQFFDKNKNPIDNRKPGLNAYKTTVGKQHNINQITVPTNAYFVRFSARMYDDGLIKVEQGSTPSDYSVAPNDALEAVKTVQRQLDGSWSVQNINGVGSIVSQINATNNQILIEAEKIRLKGKTLLDELTAIQGYFKRLFVGEGAFAKLNAEIIGSKTITADKLIMDQAMARLFVSSNIFTDALAAKEAFINKLRSVVVTATLLEGFQGLIGGFRFGQYPNRNGYFITGISSVSVGMGNGTNAGANRNAFWANWGESLDTPGPKAWYVNTDGKMYCRNEATFHSKVDFSSISNPNFYSKIKAHKGVWVGTDDVNGEGDNPDGGYNRVVWWSQIVTGKWRQYAGITTASDKKLKENIESTPVRALDKINALNLVAFDYIKDKTHEEIGLIAQEVLNIIPSSVEKYEDEDNHLTINYSKFVPYLIKAIQELNQKIEKMEKTIS
ncbi:phage tail spike protein [Streptococcus oralis]|uniref:phage tail spike protein n=1 Tax=Streptococcus oralis TaxID=1303 RepID=UPI0025575345|nr:phage tail spike protein [Streptococcus oralis]MDK7308161.1 phage tail spike protein [Streptococcus oralis]MDK7311531.1 phage tail spike protein [Streptococcus oralis]MDK7311589.1 phage tail spike protein [Streptococcus oralis]